MVSYHIASLLYVNLGNLMIYKRLMLFVGILIVAPDAMISTLSANSDQGQKIIPTLELIMSDSDWMGNAPENGYFSDDSSAVFYQIKQQGNQLRDWYRFDLNIKTAVKLSPIEAEQRDARRGQWSQNLQQKVFIKDNDVYLKDFKTGKIKQLTQTSIKETGASFIEHRDPDADKSTVKSVSFWQENKLLSLNSEGMLEEIASLELLDKPKKKQEYDLLKSKQQEYFISLNDIKKNKALVKQRKDKLPSNLREPFYLGKDFEVVEKQLNPTGEYLLLVVKDKNYDKGTKGKMPLYVTASGYVEIEDVRTRVGENSPSPSQVLLLDLTTHAIREVNLDALSDIHTDPLLKLRKSALKWHMSKGATKQEAEDLVRAPTTRGVFVPELEWSKDGMTAAIMFRAIDNKDRWIATLDLDSGDLKQQHQLTDEAWINWNFNDYGWLPDNKSIWFQSEESGYSHLYIRDLKKKKIRRLTKGKWEVSSPVLSKSGDKIYFRANSQHPGQYEIYSVDLKTGKTTQLTHLGGNNDFQLSEGETHLLITHSTSARQPELYIKSLQTNDKAVAITDTVSEKFASIDWVVPEIVEIPSSHVNGSVKSKLYKPENFDEGKQYPAVFFVHGAGYLQNSDSGWSYYYHEMMFHTFLVNQGYVVLDMDYRGSAGYGRDWRTAIYRNMGHPEVEDLEDGINWLSKNWRVDPEKVGVYGGSYGGFLTFMSMFTKPDLFAAGAALRPVSDWAHYNHGYTANILNTPAIDPVAYEVSSPIEHAKGLTKPLLILTGMLDNNVFFQDSVRLVQRLIELEKENFEMAVYPMERHGFKIPSSWLDEYRRIFKLMESNLK